MKLSAFVKKRIACLLVFAISNYAITAQVLIKGVVYDRTQQFAMQGVTVMGTSGSGTVTDSTGHYSIKLPSRDSIYFSYLGKTTLKFPVSEITDNLEFDMSIDAGVDSLPSVLVWSKNYMLDSLTNRKEYGKIFDYEGGQYVDNMKSNKRGGLGIGLDMDMFFNAKSNRRILAFQQRLEQEEQQNYIDHRFTRAVVKRVTGFEPPMLDSFMVQSRPSYDFLKSFENDWEFYKYILDTSKLFAEMWKQDHPIQH